MQLTVPDTLRDERARGWFHLDNEIIEEYLPRIGVTAFAVYACIVRHADRDGKAFPSYSKLQKHTGCGRTTISTALKALVEAGLIVIAPGDVRTSNVYRIVTPSPTTGLVPPRDQSRSRTAPSPVVRPDLVTQRDSNNTHRTKPKEQDPIAPPPPVVRAYPAEFRKWWDACPQRMRRCSISEAASAWARATGRRAPLSEMLRVLALQAVSHDWTKEGGRYVPMATTYLNQSRWEVDADAFEPSVRANAPAAVTPVIVPEKEMTPLERAWREARGEEREMGYRAFAVAFNTNREASA